MRVPRPVRFVPSPFIWAAAISLAFTAGGCLGAEAESVEPTSIMEQDVTSVPCIGAPADDTNTYGEPRVFLEAQGWWGQRRSDGSVPKLGDAEHVHVGMCFPLQQTVSGKKKFRVRVMGHNLPVGSLIRSTNLHDPDGGSFTKISWNRTVVAADNGNVELWGDAIVDTADVPSGLREFRILTVVERPNDAELHASSGWCWKTANGGASRDSGTCATSPRSTQGRGWYDCFEYKVAETRDWAYPYGGIPKGADYALSVGLRDGAGTNNLVTSWQARLDPNFHQGVAGTLLGSGSKPAYGTELAVDGSLLTAGIHRLTLIASANGKCTSGTGITPQDGEVSAVFVVPLLVK